MMKRFIIAMIAVTSLFFNLFATAAVAVESPAKMQKAVAEMLKNKETYYDNGSLHIKDVQTIELEEPVKKISTVKVALAEYKTVRDDIFYFTHNEVVVYNPETEKTVDTAVAVQIQQVQEYKDHYEDVTGSHMHILTVLLLCSLMIIIPGFCAYVWAKQQHSVLGYKLRNNLFEYGKPNSFN